MFMLDTWEAGWDSGSCWALGREAGIVCLHVWTLGREAGIVDLHVGHLEGGFS